MAAPESLPKAPKAVCPRGQPPFRTRDVAPFSKRGRSSMCDGGAVPMNPQEAEHVVSQKCVRCISWPRHVPAQRGPLPPASCGGQGPGTESLFGSEVPDVSCGLLNAMSGECWQRGAWQSVGGVAGVAGPCGAAARGCRPAPGESGAPPNARPRKDRNSEFAKYGSYWMRAAFTQLPSWGIVEWNHGEQGLHRLNLFLC